MKIIVWLAAILAFLWFRWVFVAPPIAARITMSKWFRRATMGDDFK